MSDLSRTDKQSLIRQSYNYNDNARRMASCNALYMGSMATCLLIGALGGDWPKTGLDACLEAATDAQLDAGLEECANIIKQGRLVP